LFIYQNRNILETIPEGDEEEEIPEQTTPRRNTDRRGRTSARVEHPPLAPEGTATQIPPTSPRSTSPTRSNRSRSNSPSSSSESGSDRKQSLPARNNSNKNNANNNNANNNSNTDESYFCHILQRMSNKGRRRNMDDSDDIYFSGSTTGTFRDHVLLRSAPDGECSQLCTFQNSRTTTRKFSEDYKRSLCEGISVLSQSNNSKKCSKISFGEPDHPLEDTLCRLLRDSACARTGREKVRASPRLEVTDSQCPDPCIVTSLELLQDDQIHLVTVLHSSPSDNVNSTLIQSEESYRYDILQQLSFNVYNSGDRK